MANKVIQGNLDAKGLKFAILVTRFNSLITDRLLAGAKDALARTGCAEGNIEIIMAPGSFFGPEGEGYVRGAMVPSLADCERAAALLEDVLAEVTP